MIFVGVILKEGFGRWGPANPSFGMTQTLELHPVTFLYNYFLYLVSYHTKKERFPYQTDDRIVFWCIHRLYCIVDVIP